VRARVASLRRCRDEAGAIAARAREVARLRAEVGEAEGAAGTLREALGSAVAQLQRLRAGYAEQLLRRQGERQEADEGRLVAEEQGRELHEMALHVRRRAEALAETLRQEHAKAGALGRQVAAALEVGSGRVGFASGSLGASVVADDAGGFAAGDAWSGESAARAVGSLGRSRWRSRSAGQDASASSAWLPKEPCLAAPAPPGGGVSTAGRDASCTYTSTSACIGRPSPGQNEKSERSPSGALRVGSVGRRFAQQEGGAW